MSAGQHAPAPLLLNLSKEEYEQRAWIEQDERCLQLSVTAGRGVYGVSIRHAQLQMELKLLEQVR